MANDLLTRDDIIRGKQNFTAFDAYLDGSEGSQVTLPSGKKIKTRAGIEKELHDRFPASKAGLYDVGTEPGNVMIVGSFGLGGEGSLLPVAQDNIESYSRSGFYRHKADTLQKPPSASATVDGDVSITAAYSRTHFSRLYFSREDTGRLYFEMVANGVSGGYSEVYHSRNKRPYNTTTATSANVVVTATGELQRSTSSAIFKKDIADISIPDYRAALKAVRPVSYRSTDATADRTDWSWYSFIAEELAAIDPRLVQMSSTEFFEDTDEEGNAFINSRELPEGEYAANGINTNGIVALMSYVNQQMLADIEALEDEKTQLKRRMTNLEKRMDTFEQAANQPAQ